jgi:hypothetical protein
LLNADRAAETLMPFFSASCSIRRLDRLRLTAGMPVAVTCALYLPSYLSASRLTCWKDLLRTPICLSVTPAARSVIFIAGVSLPVNLSPSEPALPCRSIAAAARFRVAVRACFDVAPWARIAAVACCCAVLSASCAWMNAAIGLNWSLTALFSAARDDRCRRTAPVVGSIEPLSPRWALAALAAAMDA